MWAANSRDIAFESHGRRVRVLSRPSLARLILADGKLRIGARTSRPGDWNGHLISGCLPLGLEGILCSSADERLATPILSSKLLACHSLSN